MTKKIKLLITLSLILGSSFSFAVKSSPSEYSGVISESTYQLCFTPSQKYMQCTNMIVHAIKASQDSIIVQAYSFTSKEIVKAIIEAHKRGVNIIVLLDESNITSKYSVIRTLTNAKIPVYIDDKPAIAHNKVMIIDAKKVITGSFNFTESAQIRNAENVLIINNKKLANEYKSNIDNRMLVSQSLPDYCESTGACKSWWDTVKSSSSSIYEKTKQSSTKAWEKVKNWWNSN